MCVCVYQRISSNSTINLLSKKKLNLFYNRQQHCEPAGLRLSCLQTETNVPSCVRQNKSKVPQRRPAAWSLTDPPIKKRNNFAVTSYIQQSKINNRVMTPRYCCYLGTNLSVGTLSVRCMLSLLSGQQICWMGLRFQTLRGGGGGADHHFQCSSRFYLL